MMMSAFFRRCEKTSSQRFENRASPTEVI